MSYGYDDFGNLATQALGGIVNKTLRWDAENRLIEVKDTKANRTVNLKYDPLGRRIEKKVTEGSGAAVTVRTISYFYDEEDIILETLDVTVNGSAQPRVTTFYVHGPGIDEQLAMVRGGKSYYFHADGLGSVVGITDDSRMPVQRYKYDSFGVVSASAPEFENSYAFTGREWDRETGLYYYRSRYYDPMEGRFVSRDPIGFAGGDVNLYGYVQNNPINFIDPEGLMFVGKIISLGRRSFEALGRVTFNQAVKEAKSDEDIIAKNRKVAEEIARAMGDGKKPVHDLPHGPVSEGYRPHYHAYDREGGHIFYSVLGFLVSLLDPFDAIAGELADEDALLERYYQKAPCE